MQSTGHLLVKLRMPPTKEMNSYCPPHSTSPKSVLLGKVHVPSSHNTSPTSTCVRVCMVGDIIKCPLHSPAQARSSEAVVPHCLQPRHQPADHDHPRAVATAREHSSTYRSHTHTIKNGNDVSLQSYSLIPRPHTHMG